MGYQNQAKFVRKFEVQGSRVWGQMILDMPPQNFTNVLFIDLRNLPNKPENQLIKNTVDFCFQGSTVQGTPCGAMRRSDI